MKILILKPSSLGDVVQALPVLRMLKRRYPSSQIYWWIATELAPLLQEDPDLSGTFPFDRREATNPFFWPELFGHVAEMRGQRFDYVIDLQSLARSAIIAWFANGATTIGLNDPREGAAAFYDLAIPRPSWNTHAVDWYLQVLKPLDTPINWRFDWLPARPEVQQRVAHRFPRGGARITLIPGARWQNKRWPVEYFAQLARLLLDHSPECQVTVLGGKSDLPLGRAIKDAAPGAVQDLTGRTTLPEMVEVLRDSDLVVTNDTGPMHIAAALRVPVVPLFGPTVPARTGPFGQLQAVRQLQSPACIPCLKDRCDHEPYLACLKELRPRAIFDHLLSQLPALNNRAARRVDTAVA